MRNLRLSMLLLGLVMALGVSAQGRCKGFVFDTDGYVNVRKSPTTNSPVVRKMDNDQILFYEPTGSNWYKVSLTEAGAVIGYVYWNRIAVAADDLGGYVVTDPDGFTNVRASTSTKSAVVQKMKRNTMFTGTPAYVGGKRSNWIGVLDENQKLIGFVYLTKVRGVE